MLEQARPPLVTGLAYVDGDSAGMYSHRRRHFQNLFAQLADAPALFSDLLHQHPQTVHQLVRIQTQ